MMREIKFRAFGKNSHEMLTDGDGTKGFTIKQLGYLEDLDSWEIMQYTGLKDKNGVEIYEGDVLKTTFFGHADDSFTVVYVDWAAAFEAISSKSQDGYHLDGMKWEVIGNIYENPELLDNK